MNGLSLIIPIYNVEDFIEECLISIVKSMGEIPNIEIILVDDGSKDKSADIAMEFDRLHPNFIYVKKENGGLSDARNYGLKYAKYDYVGFIDSDDSITVDYFEEIFKSLKKKPDLVVFDWLDVDDTNYKNVVKGIDSSEDLWTMKPSAWNKVYKKSLFDEMEFPKGMIYEDVGTVYKMIFNINEYVYINKPLYRYRKNRGGSILSTISPKINDIYEVLDDTYLYYKKKKALSELNIEGLCYQYVKLLLWSNMYRQLKFHKFNFIGFYKKMKETRNVIYMKFPNWKNNIYLKKNAEYFRTRLGVNFIHNLDK